MMLKCPEAGTILLKFDMMGEIPHRDVEIRCPSCTNHFHNISELDIEQ